MISGKYMSKKVLEKPRDIDILITGSPSEGKVGKGNKGEANKIDGSSPIFWNHVTQICRELRVVKYFFNFPNSKVTEKLQELR